MIFINIHMTLPDLGALFLIEKNKVTVCNTKNIIDDIHQSPINASIVSIIAEINLSFLVKSIIFD